MPPTPPPWLNPRSATVPAPALYDTMARVTAPLVKGLGLLLVGMATAHGSQHFAYPTKPKPPTAPKWPATVSDRCQVCALEFARPPREAAASTRVGPVRRPHGCGLHARLSRSPQFSGLGHVGLKVFLSLPRARPRCPVIVTSRVARNGAAGTVLCFRLSESPL